MAFTFRSTLIVDSATTITAACKPAFCLTTQNLGGSGRQRFWDEAIICNPFPPIEYTNSSNKKLLPRRSRW